MIQIVVNINWKKTVVISLGLLFTLYIAIVTNENHFFNSKDCIVWKVDHYEKASCFTTNALDNSKYKINIDLFKKVTVDTSTVLVLFSFLFDRISMIFPDATSDTRGGIVQ